MRSPACFHDREILMMHLGEIAPEPGIYFFHNKEGHVLYVGKSNNLRARLRQHKANYDAVKSWICFFDQQFENLNVRIRDAHKQAASTSLDKLSGIIAWPLALIESTLAIDCACESIDAVNVDQCPPEELDRKEFVYVRSLKPPFNYQYNNELPSSERWKYYPRDYLKTKALSKLLSHRNRMLAMRMLDGP